MDNTIEHHCNQLQNFRLYETQQRFYFTGTDKNKKYWRVLKLDRSEPSELHICEDPVVYSLQELKRLLQRIREGNLATGGLGLVTKAYGILGCVKFLEPYYILLITKRRKVGHINGHTIYGIEDTKIIPIPHATVQTELAYSKTELRYKKLISSIFGSRKDFFFSYSYPITQSLQRNMSQQGEKEISYIENMFTWNAFIAQGIHQQVNNQRWTVPLIHGSFEQVKMSVSDNSFFVTLVSRRSRHFAGTRYLKRGVSKEGKVANDVETEQIVMKEVSSSCDHMGSVVQMRGSIPLFWSQGTSHFKPDIILQQYDPTYEATRLHFEDLAERYGNPIIILNLIKAAEKKPREMLICHEFANSIQYLNATLPKEAQLQFIHCDFKKITKSKNSDVIYVLESLANEALDSTGIYCSGASCHNKRTLPREGELGDERQGNTESNESTRKETIAYQNGVLRTNCIDCLDRTNVAQYAYGFAALSRQLHSIGIVETPKENLDMSISVALMEMYRNMGDALAFQYGGSAAHNSVFTEVQGKWKATSQPQELITSLRRYYSNTYTDIDKQHAIDLCLGHFQPQKGKPDIWELDSENQLQSGNSNNPDNWLVKTRNPLIQLRRTMSALPGASDGREDRSMQKSSSSNKIMSLDNESEDGDACACCEQTTHEKRPIWTRTRSMQNRSKIFERSNSEISYFGTADEQSYRLNNELHSATSCGDQLWVRLESLHE